MSTSTETTLNHLCGICQAQQKKTNTCTTQCGHVYCLTCIVKHMEDSYECPICSASLNEHDSPETVESHFDDHQVGCIDRVADILEGDGINMLDVLVYYSGRYNSKTYPYWPRNRDCHLEHIERVEEVINNAFKEVDREHNNTDKNTK